MAKSVLDSSALLAVINGETGADIVRNAMLEASISTVNLSEVVAKLAERGMTEEAIRDILRPFPIETVSFDAEQAYQAGMLRPSTKKSGLSMGERACFGLALKLQAPVLTGDRSWERVTIGTIVKIIR